MDNKINPGISTPKVKQTAMLIATAAAAKKRDTIFENDSEVPLLFSMRCNKNQVKNGKMMAPIQLGMGGMFSFIKR